MLERRKEITGRLLRLALAVTALSLWVYIPYRYMTRPPQLDGLIGTSYALLFPLAALLALWGFAAAWRPERLRRLADGDDTGGPGTPFRWILGSYGAAWLVMGLFCVPSLSQLAAISPVKGLFSTIHMTAQHVFLGLVAVTAAWRPRVLMSLLLGAPVPASGAEMTAGEARGAR